jgi:hypothetical protein
MKLFWTEPAIQDLRDLRYYFAPLNPKGVLLSDEAYRADAQSG